MKKYVLYALLLLLSGILLFLVRQPKVKALFLSKKHFIQSEIDPRVFYEPGSEKRADDLARWLPSAIQKVEEGQFSPFKKPFKVYVFDTQESYNKHVGDPPGSLSRGASFGGNVFITPRAFNFLGHDTHKESLIHELSHLHLTQALGISVLFGKVPFWFGEGLADIMAGTGGETVTDSMAIRAFLSGDSFVPDEKGRFLKPIYVPDNGMEWPMFKKQSKMFVGYLRQTYPEAFEKLLIAIYNRETFSSSFSKFFGKNVIGMWEEFVDGMTTFPQNIDGKYGGIIGE